MGGKMLQEVRQDLTDVVQVCEGKKKQTNDLRTLVNDLVKGEPLLVASPSPPLTSRAATGVATLRLFLSFYSLAGCWRRRSCGPFSSVRRKVYQRFYFSAIRFYVDLNRSTGIY